jgi:hypothetical protein
MTDRIIKNATDRALLIKYIWARELPFVVSITKGKRTIPQNRLQMQWIKEAAEQMGDRTFEELRGECKLTFGVPILRAENPEFRKAYDKHIKPLPYETKLAMMREPFDFAVTRLMNTDQLTRYLDQLGQHFLEQGIVLTDPEKRKAA